MDHKQILQLAKDKGAPGTLVRHLEMVAEATGRLAEMIPLNADREFALAGASCHDLAKIKFPEEISGPGRRHSDEGEDFLLDLGLPPILAAFAPGHMEWSSASPVEHVLVAAADSVWKGAHCPSVEDELTRRLTEQGMPHYEAWMVVNEAMTEVGNQGLERLQYQRSEAPRPHDDEAH